MYDVKGKSGSVDKEFIKIISSLTKEDSKNVMEILENSPKGNPKLHKKIKQVTIDGKKCWQYDLNWGDRIIYRVVDEKKEVLVYYIGDHKGAEIFRRKGKIK